MRYFLLDFQRFAVIFHVVRPPGTFSASLNVFSTTSNLISLENAKTLDPTAKTLIELPGQPRILSYSTSKKNRLCNVDQE
ncbi:hypothetical protein L596_013869 [Steinernema carpocapsae]|uniref:Uncharacterized protein n=1 Tax=Steinernema carpocapsae TaxID=34508 RepID=A0A4U5P1I2_STECR|nr:hypothetical protein L596_013869 [Steinernema carpocapsae]